jgi:hypothetical protein
MRSLINRLLKPWIILPVFVLAGIIYTLMLTITIPRVMSFAGGMKILDMMPAGYNASYAGALLNALGDTGRHLYLSRQIPLDLLFPALFGVSFCMIIAYFLTRLEKIDTPLFYLSLIPLLAGICDYCENTGIIVLLNSYPVIRHSVVQVTNIFSILKSSSTTISFVILTVLIVLSGVKYFRENLGARN